MFTPLRASFGWDWVGLCLVSLSLFVAVAHDVAVVAYYCVVVVVVGVLLCCSEWFLQELTRGGNMIVKLDLQPSGRNGRTNLTMGITWRV